MRSSQRTSSRIVPRPQERGRSAEMGIWPKTVPERSRQHCPHPRTLRAPGAAATPRGCSPRRLGARAHEADPALRPPAHFLPGRLTQCSGLSQPLGNHEEEQEEPAGTVPLAAGRSSAGALACARLDSCRRSGLSSCRRARAPSAWAGLRGVFKFPFCECVTSCRASRSVLSRKRT